MVAAFGSGRRCRGPGEGHRLRQGARAVRLAAHREAGLHPQADPALRRQARGRPRLHRGGGRPPGRRRDRPAGRRAPSPSSSRPRPANACADAAIQALGGYGYISEYDVEKIKRDVKITTIYEGTSEIQQLIISTFRWRSTVSPRAPSTRRCAEQMDTVHAGTVRPQGRRASRRIVRLLNRLFEEVHKAKATRQQHVMFQLADPGLASPRPAPALVRQGRRARRGAGYGCRREASEYPGPLRPRQRCFGRTDAPSPSPTRSSTDRACGRRPRPDAILESSGFDYAGISGRADHRHGRSTQPRSRRHSHEQTSAALLKTVRRRPRPLRLRGRRRRPAQGARWSRSSTRSPSTRWATWSASARGEGPTVMVAAHMDEIGADGLAHRRRRLPAVRPRGRLVRPDHPRAARAHPHRATASASPASSARGRRTSWTPKTARR